MIPVVGFKTEVMDDPRGALERLSRQSLYYLLVANKVQGVTDSMPKDKMLKMAELHDGLIDYRADGKFSYKNVEAYLDNNNQIKIVRPLSTYPDEKKAGKKDE